MRDVVIAGYLRTAQSRSRRDDAGRDWFHKVRADELLGKLLPELVKRAGIDASEVDDCITGSARGVAEQWTYGGRNPVFLANFPETVAAKFVDQQCGSAMAAIHIGFLEIAAGYADIVIGAGMEHMTRIPMTGGGCITRNPALFTEEKYAHWDMLNAMNMGLTAEKLFYLRENISKEDMDRWGVRSHNLAEKARNEGFFDGEIMPIEAEQADGSTMIVDKDQSIRDGATYEATASLKPAFAPNSPDWKYYQGAITAGNSSPLNAAATSMLLMSRETAEKKGIRPMATIRSVGFAGVDPTIMGVGPVPASKKALEFAGLEPKDIDYWEINEAFCVVALNCINELDIEPERVNVMGGATAIGHPLGATGVRLVGTLARILEVKGGRYGVATACCGGGQGVATVIEREA